MTRIAVVDPQPAIRAGLAVLLRGEPGLVPVGAAAGASDAPDLLARERPDIVLLEPSLLDGDGIALCRRLTAEPGAPRIILYTARPGEEIELLARVAGASGLIDKAAPRTSSSSPSAGSRAATRRCRRSPARSSTPPRTASTPTTSPCSPCSWTARRRRTSPRRCGWTTAAASGGSSA